MSFAGPSDDRPAESLIQSGFALEIADAPLLHLPLTLADIAHVLDLRSRRIIPAAAAARRLSCGSSCPRATSSVPPVTSKMMDAILSPCSMNDQSVSLCRQMLYGDVA